MENEYPEEQEESQEEIQEEHVEIYSKWAILGFSIFFSTLIGGILLIINLRKAGYKQAVYTVLAFMIGYTLAGSILLGGVGGNLSLVVNVIGGFILSGYFFPKYFPDNDYYPRPIWGALAISVLVSVTAVLILYYTGHLPELNAAMAKK